MKDSAILARTAEDEKFGLRVSSELLIGGPGCR
jgi:hypothetical protein